jgi:hypothetical protein
MKQLRAFGWFWWDFVVGDDPLIALGVIVAIGAAAGLEQVGVSAFWLLPLAVAGLLWMSLARARNG